MKTHILFFFLGLLTFAPLVGQTNVDPSAALEIDSTTKGFLPPRMTTTQRDAISSPAAGLLIFNTSTQRINVYNNSTSSWNELGLAGVAPTVASVLSSFTFTYDYLEGSPAYGEVEVEVTNNSLSTLNMSFATGDITLSGVSGVSVSAVSDSAEDISPGDSYTVTYTLSGSANSSGTLTAAYAFSNLSASVNKTVSENTTITHDALNYREALSINGVIWLDRNLGALRVAQAFNDHQAYGDLYEWGRAADGHEDITWTSSTAGTADNGTTATRADVPANALFITTPSGAANN